MSVNVRSNYNNQTAHETILDMFQSSMEQELATIDYDRIFMVRDTEKRRQTEQLNHGMSGIKKVAENQDYPEITGEEGASVSWTQGKYGGDVVVTEDLRIYDEYDQLDDEIGSVMEELADKLQTSHYDVLNNAWSSSYTNAFGETVTATWPDGLTLANASHHKHTGVGSSGGTFSNVINDGTNSNPVLSFTALDKARQVGKLFKDTHVVNRPISFDTLLVWPDLETLAERIVNSSLMYDTANNDINPLKGRFKIKVSPYVDSGKWFLYNENKAGKTLKSFFKTRPMIKAPKEFEPNDNWHYVVKTRFAYGFSYAPYILFSKGDNS